MLNSLNECYLVLAVRTNTVHVCILAMSVSVSFSHVCILPCNPVKYRSFSQIGLYICQSHSLLTSSPLRVFISQYSCIYWSNFETLSCYIVLNTLSQGIILGACMRVHNLPVTIQLYNFPPSLPWRRAFMYDLQVNWGHSLWFG